MLYALLNKHPKVGLMYEADLILLRSVFFKSRRFCDWAQRWQFWDKAFTRHNLDPDEFARKGIGDFPTAFAAVHTEFAKRKGRRYGATNHPIITTGFGTSQEYSHRRSSSSSGAIHWEPPTASRARRQQAITTSIEEARPCAA